LRLEHLRILALAELAFALLFSNGVWAQGFQLCVPAPIGLPTFGPEPPDWDTTGTRPCVSGSACADSSDPRWAAAPLYPMKSGVTHLSFRALAPVPSDPLALRELYVQVRCRLGGASACTLGTDELMFGGVTTEPAIVRVQLPLASCGAESRVLSLGSASANTSSATEPSRQTCRAPPRETLCTSTRRTSGANRMVGSRTSESCFLRR
jgi:hypothetical protein